VAATIPAVPVLFVSTEVEPTTHIAVVPRVRDVASFAAPAPTKCFAPTVVIACQRLICAGARPVGITRSVVLCLQLVYQVSVSFAFEPGQQFRCLGHSLPCHGESCAGRHHRGAAATGQRVLGVARSSVWRIRAGPQTADYVHGCSPYLSGRAESQIKALIFSMSFSTNSRSSCSSFEWKESHSL
jgi:hypothetical protein